MQVTGVLADFSGALGQVPAEFTTQQGVLTQAAGVAGAGWVGVAGGQFVSMVGVAGAQVAALARAHEVLHAHVSRYHVGVGVAQGRCVGAHRDMWTALDAYADAARRAVDGLVNGLGVVIGKLWHLITHPWEIIEDGIDAIRGHHAKAKGYHDAVSGWSMPNVAPTLEPVSASETAQGLGMDGWVPIQDLLGQFAGFLVSNLVEGIEDLFKWGEGVLEGAMDAVEAAEQAVAQAIAAVQRDAREAMDDLASLGRRVAQGLETEVARAFDEVERIGKDLAKAGRDTLKVAEVMAAMDVLAIEQFLGVHEGPRLNQVEGNKLGSDALNKWLRDSSYRKYVTDLFSLSQGAYHDDGSLPGNSAWKPVREIRGPDGGFAVVYEDAGPPKRYVVAFRGTQPSDAGDDATDVENAADFPTAQGRWAIQVAQQYAQPPYKASFTGHSLGGSLAALASLATGRPATTFNAAGVGDGNYSLAVQARYGKPRWSTTGGRSHSWEPHGGKLPESQITNYHTPDDPITNGQKDLGLRPASGAQVTVAGKHHGVGAVVKGKTHTTGDFNFNGPVSPG